LQEPIEGVLICLGHAGFGVVEAALEVDVDVLVVSGRDGPRGEAESRAVLREEGHGGHDGGIGLRLGGGGRGDGGHGGGGLRRAHGHRHPPCRRQALLREQLVHGVGVRHGLDVIRHLNHDAPCAENKTQTFRVTHNSTSKQCIVKIKHPF